MLRLSTSRVYCDQRQSYCYGSKIADPDSFGACMGIYRAAVSLEKKAHIVINEVTGSVRPLYDEIFGEPCI